MLDLSYIIQDMTTDINTKASEFKIIEDSKLMNLPLNPEATTLWRATFTKDKYAFGYDDFVVGPAILIKKAALKTWAA